MYLKQFHLHIISLNNILASGEYELVEGSTYSFNSNVGHYNSETSGVLSYLTYTDDEYEFEYYNSQTFVDDYIEDLVGYRSQYIAGINNASFDIFNVVYYSLGSVADGKLTNATGVDLSIYLANDQGFGTAPAFKHKYAKIIAWSSNETEIQDKSFYLTSDFTEDLKAEIYQYDQNENRPEKWSYSANNVVLNTVYAYRLELYYLTKRKERCKRASCISASRR